MTKKISFKNLDSKVDLAFDLDKEFIVIFGKNGAGKTTISRNTPDKECVFNTDFIHKNIYVETQAGATDDAKTKEAFSELWIGESIIALKKELDEIKSKRDTISKQKEELWMSVLKEFSEKQIQLINLKSVNDKVNVIPFVKPKDESDDDIILNYKPKVTFESTIKNDDELNQSILRLKNNELAQLLIKQLKSNDFLKALFLDNDDKEKVKLLNKITRFNEICANLKELDESFKSNNVEKEEKWIKDALLLHENADFCYFCGNNNIKDAIEKWNKFFSSELKMETNASIAYIDEIIKSIDLILRQKDSLSKIAINTILSIEKINEYLCTIRKKMCSREIVTDDVIFPTIKKDELVEEENKFLENIQHYIFKKYSAKYEILYLLLNDYETSITAKDLEIEKEMNDNAESITKSINDHLEELDFDKELKIGIDKRGNDKKYKFSFKNSSTKIGTLSDGQKHKLALAIFFASIEKMDLTDKTVVLDDPIVTLDYRSYYSVKRKIIDLRNTKNPACVLLLTCNIDYLYIQLTNLFNRNDVTDTKMLHLTERSIDEVDYNIINYDDLSLFENGLKQISSFEEYNLVASLCVRIYRMFLDFYLRMRGYPSNGNPKDEICLIDDLDVETKNILIEDNKYIEKIGRKTSATNKDLYQLFVKTNEFVTLLGFPSVIKDDDFDILRVYSNDEKRASNYAGNSLLFLVIARAMCVFNSTNEKYKVLKDYLNHPRTQLSSSIVGVDFSDLEIKGI